MKKIKSQGLGVNTLAAATTPNMDIVDVGQLGLRQFYYRTQKTYAPDRELTPLVLRPVLKVYNPDLKQTYEPTVTSVVWRAVDTAGNVSEYVISDTAADYSVAKDGTLTVRKNTPFDNGVTLTCTMSYTDPNTGRPGQESRSVTLTTDDVAESAYTLNISGTFNGHTAGDRIYWDPLSGVDPVMSFTARAERDGEDMSDKVKFFWYYLHNGKEVLVDDADDPCLAYISGQGTATLNFTADAEAEVLEFVVRIAESTSSVSAKDATAPNVDGVWARATERWLVRRLRGRVYTDNGDTARQELGGHTYRALYRENGWDVPEDIARERIVNYWKKTSIGDDGKKIEESLGTGYEITVPESELTDARGLPVNIDAEGVVESPLGVVVQDGMIVTQEIDGVKYRVVSRLTE